MYGYTDYPLTKRGIEDAELVASKLRDSSYTVCYSSLLKRASHTADICVTNRNIPVIRVDNLNEQYMGDFENISFQDMMVKYPKESKDMMDNWVKNGPVGGETFDELYERVSVFADMILEKKEDVLIVAHFGSLAALMVRILGMEKECANNFLFEHGRYSEIVINEFGTRLAHLNC
jgi:probable phosphoglycerate mutase